MMSQNRVNLDSWSLQPLLAVDSWLSEPFMNHETDVLTRALQIELCNSDSSGIISSSDAGPTPTHHAGGSHTNAVFASASSGTTVNPSSSEGKTSRRKPRKSKKSPTTVIDTDAANFRQMVQQITGTRCPIVFGSGNSPVLRPEPKRPRIALPDDASATSSYVLPTLDTSSAFLFNQAGLAQLETFPDDGVTIPEIPTLDFGSFPSAAFPTLESWSPPFASFINQFV